MDYKKYYKLQSSSLKNKTMFDAFNWILDQYKNLRIDQTVIKNDGDMLLFQWGSNPWDPPRTLNIDLTRQVLFANGEDDEIFQISCRFLFDGNIERSGNQWCSNPDDLSSFRTMILDNPWYLKYKLQTPKLIKVEMNCAG